MSNTAQWLPPNYPSYFDDKGIVRREYVLELAKSIAKRFERDELTKNQLQAFYRHVRRLSDSLAYASEEESTGVIRKLQAMESLAKYSLDRKVIPLSFFEFLTANIERCGDRRTFRRGFVEHFQAVVGFCAGQLRDKRGGE